MGEAFEPMIEGRTLDRSEADSVGFSARISACHGVVQCRALGI